MKKPYWLKNAEYMCGFDSEELGNQHPIDQLRFRMNTISDRLFRFEMEVVMWDMEALDEGSTKYEWTSYRRLDTVGVDGYEAIQAAQMVEDAERRAYGNW